MTELQIQGTYIKDFFSLREDGLHYNWVSATTVCPETHIIESDLKAFLKDTTFNYDIYAKMLREKYHGDERLMMQEIIEELSLRLASAQNAAIFFNQNKNFTFKGYEFTLFAPSGSELRGDKDFVQNIFSVVEEYTFKRLNIRPDLCFFLNGIFFGYSELKSNLSNQYARTNGRKKVFKDFIASVQCYHEQAAGNDVQRTLERKVLFPFCKAIHLTTTDIEETYVVRNLIQFMPDVREAIRQNPNNPDFSETEKSIFKGFKPYPNRLPKSASTRLERFEEVMRALYSKEAIEKEILYYNFIEYKLVKDGKGNKVRTTNDGRLISPRPKQKFGADKIIAKIPEFLANENDPEYFYRKLENRLREDGINEEQIRDAVEKRRKYQNNKNVYSLLLQYAAGFGKSNIIGWTALQLKDLRDKNHRYVYDKIMIVVDRLQLRDQLDTTLHNMNIQKAMFAEASNSRTFKAALTGDRRIVVVNVQKFGSASGDSTKEFLDKEAMAKLAKMRVCFLIDEVHRTQSGELHDDMLSLFDELQAAFDNNPEYNATRTKKNLIIGFTATPSDNTLARFGEFAKYEESEIKWVPFDAYTMREAIKDGYILDPTKGIVPVAAKMYFEEPDEEGFIFKGKTYNQMTPEDWEKLYSIRKEKIYSNPERIEAISRWIVKRLLETVYKQIKGEAKAMLAVSTIPNAIEYHRQISKIYAEEVQKKAKYKRFENAPVYIVYSERQDVASPDKLNGGKSEQQVLQDFCKVAKNGIIIVVDKLQTGFDEPKLHTLFLDKEIRGINAIQTISRVNRTCKYKNDCKIIDFSHLNCNVKNIRKAFDKYADMVVSEFNPFDDEKTLKEDYKIISQSPVYKQFSKLHKQVESGTFEQMEELQEQVRQWILDNMKEAGLIYKKANEFFRLLNLLEYVLELDKKYSDCAFAAFWNFYGRIYRKVTAIDGPDIDYIEVYFDNKIGILQTDGEEEPGGKGNSKGGSGNGVGGGSTRERILEEIRKRNEKEQDIEEQIKQFEQCLSDFFDYIAAQPDGQRLISKINSGNQFTDENKRADFNGLSRKYILLKGKFIPPLFKKELKDNIESFFDIFEELCRVHYRTKSMRYSVPGDEYDMAADGLSL